MTKIVHPFGYRLGVIRGWKNTWYGKDEKQFVQYVREDYLLRRFLMKELDGKMVSDITFERNKKNDLLLTIKSARPGLIIGKEGAGSEEMVKKIKKFAHRKEFHGLGEVSIRIEEIRSVETEAPLIAEMIGEQLKKRMPHRRVMKQMVEKVMANREVRGVRIVLGGRLGGTDIARSEEVKKGNIPLQTLRADVDFVHRPVVLSYGTIGVKVWVYRGNLSTKKK